MRYFSSNTSKSVQIILYNEKRKSNSVLDLQLMFSVLRNRIVTVEIGVLEKTYSSKEIAFLLPARCPSMDHFPCSFARVLFQSGMMAI